MLIIYIYILISNKISTFSTIKLKHEITKIKSKKIRNKEQMLLKL